MIYRKDNQSCLNCIWRRRDDSDRLVCCCKQSVWVTHSIQTTAWCECWEQKEDTQENVE